MHKVNSKMRVDGDDDYEHERATEVPSRRVRIRGKVKHDKRGVCWGLVYE